MRLVECLFVVVELMATASELILRGTAPSWLLDLIVASIFLIIVHAWLEGPHWQLIPAYMASFLLILCLTPAGHGRMASTVLSIVAGALIMISLVLSWALPMFRLPQPSGEYFVGTRIFWITDQRRLETHAGAPPGNRQLAVQQ